MLFSIAKRKNLVIHVGHVERFNGAVQELKKIIREPLLIESRRIGPFVSRVKDDGVVMDLMIHDIDIILNLVDSELVNFNAYGRSVYSDKDDIANVQMIFENGSGGEFIIDNEYLHSFPPRGNHDQWCARGNLIPVSASTIIHIGSFLNEQCYFC